MNQDNDRIEIMYDIPNKQWLIQTENQASKIESDNARSLICNDVRLSHDQDRYIEMYNQHDDMYILSKSKTCKVCQSHHHPNHTYQYKRIRNSLMCLDCSSFN